MSDNKSKPEDYSDKSFWDKLYGYAKDAGYEVVTKALVLYYTAMDSETPSWAKASIFGALGYFISPIDAIPDFIPVVGFSDDLAAIVACTYAVASCMKEKHHKSASKQANEWFN